MHVVACCVTLVLSIPCHSPLLASSTRDLRFLPSVQSPLCPLRRASLPENNLELESGASALEDRLPLGVELSENPLQLPLADSLLIGFTWTPSIILFRVFWRIIDFLPELACLVVKSDVLSC